MVADWESKFGEWARPPGKTEEERCQNAEKAIRNAIGASQKFASRNVSVFSQGSYRNNTNVRQDSDVDIGVLCGTTYLNDYPPGTTREDFGFSASDYLYESFKNEVEESLVQYFGRNAVERGNKAFDVHETRYHVEADVAAFFVHRRYDENKDYHEGVSLRTDKEKRKIINWPEQHYRNGVGKNNDTSRRFKSLVRIVKALCNEMSDAGISAAKPIPGFLIECLVWNVPDDKFGNSMYWSDTRACLAYLFNNTMREEQCSE